MLTSIVLEAVREKTYNHASDVATLKNLYRGIESIYNMADDVRNALNGMLPVVRKVNLEPEVYLKWIGDYLWNFRTIAEEEQDRYFECFAMILEINGITPNLELPSAAEMIKYIETMNSETENLRISLLETKKIYRKAVLKQHEDVSSHYKYVGSKLSTCDGLKKFRRLIENIYHRKKDDTELPDYNGMYQPGEVVAPFVLVCCSSGTGKTQMPFNLLEDVPVLYLLDKVKSGWQLNIVFEAISNCFHEKVLHDITEIRRLDEERATRTGEPSRFAEKYFSIDDFDILEKKNLN